MTSNLLPTYGGLFDIEVTGSLGSPTAVREFTVDWLRRELVGPAPGYPMVQTNGEEILRPQDPPRYRYGCGILFPQGVRYSGGDSMDPKEASGVASATEADGSNGADTNGEDVEDTPQARSDGAAVEQEPEVAAADQFLPQTMGISFLVKLGDGLRIKARWATYSPQPIEWDNLWQAENPKIKRPESNPEFWFRTPGSEQVDFAASVLTSGRMIARKPLTTSQAPGVLELDIVSRRWGDKGERLITVTLINATRTKSPLNEKCFFQCSFDVTLLGGGEFRPYPERSGDTMDREEASLALLYRHRPTFAIGHGCAADWDESTEGTPTRLRTEILPIHRQTPIVPRDDVEGLDLGMSTLAEANRAEIVGACNALADAYETWIREQETSLSAASGLTPEMAEAGRRHMSECRNCLARVRDGISLLNEDMQALRAFKFMNMAMLQQRAHYGLSAEANDSNRRTWIKNEKGGGFRPSRRYAQPAYGGTRWRPFQLAFVLMNLRPMREPQHPSRDVVDVIWFPTGGGKTEAYLALAAYSILLRRMLNPGNAGTTALMRYTLRLLTTQQFQRAASLICALERMRRDDTEYLGTEPISIGLWVGSDVTPNNHKRAAEAYSKLVNGDRKNPFILLACPWCGIEMGPMDFDKDREVFGYENFAEAGTTKVRFRCDDPDCDFGNGGGLPVQVVDEAIYEKPPTLLIGTVDKFAMMPFLPDARSIFGIDTNNAPPDLIIQDELHLISGPLGSMVGHYETVIDELATTEAGGQRISPRIVASTATIARASEQVRAVYGRAASLFPPQALRAGESFFAREGDSAVGRAYVGVHAVALSSHVTAQVRTLSALLQAPALVSAPDGAVDPYWTLMVYFKSLRELGRAATLVRADIKEYLNAVWELIGLTGGLGGETAKDRRRFIRRFKELTSRIQSSDIPEVLRELFSTKPDTETVDLCYATNMIQVGLDVPRLSLMTIVGQPKGASEYIQASSRVGRDSRKPGLVVTNYNPFKPRDRSHFETFRSFHENAYRYVEATSVTPFSLPVCERAVHALAVTLARYLYPALRGSPETGVAPKIVSEITERIRRRVLAASPEEEGRAMGVLDRFFKDWNRVLPNTYGWFSIGDDEIPVMWPAGTERPVGLDLALTVRQTPTSMRNVDADCEAEQISLYPGVD